MRGLLDDYLIGLEESSVRSLREITEFNNSYERIELPPGTLVRRGVLFTKVQTDL